MPFLRRLAWIFVVSTALWGAPKPAILAVFAHPDDETSVGPLLARYAKEGHPVHLVSVTSGQKGVTDHAKIAAGDALAAARNKELQCAAEKLGIAAPFLLGFQDQGISTPEMMEKVADEIRGVINRTQPDVIITWGPDGLTGHPDHRTTGNLVTQVFQQQERLSHKPKKLYYVAFPESRFRTAPPPFNQPGALRTVSDAFITTEVPCTEYLPQAAAAIQCHQSQWTPERMKEISAIGEKLLEGKVFLRLAMGNGGAEVSRENDILEGLR